MVTGSAHCKTSMGAPINGVCGDSNKGPKLKVSSVNEEEDLSPQGDKVFLDGNIVGLGHPFAKVVGNESRYGRPR